MKLVAAKCPSCGANIKVDRSLKFTKCEYCDTEIMVEEAVENLLRVELKDSPTFDNYLKLGNRYYENQEFEEAYKAYSNAEEINPDNPLVVLRKGICKSMISDYNHFDIKSSINAFKNSLSLMEKMSFSKKDINTSIDEVISVLYASINFLSDIYKSNKLNKAQSTGYIERLESCLNGFIYLDSILSSNKDLEAKVVSGVIDTINYILGDGKYHLSSSYVNKLNKLKKDYITRSESLGIESKKNVYIPKKEVVVGVETKTSKIKDILCYLMICFLFILFLGSIFNNESIWSILIWIICIISFIPIIQKLLVQKIGYNAKYFVIGGRVLFLLIAFILMANSPLIFEKTYKIDNTTIRLSNGKVLIKNLNGELTGKYHWDSKGDYYYIYVTMDNNVEDEVIYRYQKNDSYEVLCLFEDNKCTITYYTLDYFK